MASATFPPILSLNLNLNRFPTPKPQTQITKRPLSLLSASASSSPKSSDHFRPLWPPFRRRLTILASSAYITGPASDAIVGDNDPKFEDLSARGDKVQPPNAISWGLMWSLLADHKYKLAVSILTLAGCTTCTLSMPIFSGRFFEVLIGARPEPLWKLLSKIGVLYALEPVFTVIYVMNMNTIWEKVMSNLRAQIFHRVLIQKVEFFDRYKVGEITALLTSDLGTLKDIVSENVSRDRGFRAFSEASYSSLSKSHWNNMHIVHSIPSTCTTSGHTYAYRIWFSCCI